MRVDDEDDTDEGDRLSLNSSSSWEALVQVACAMPPISGSAHNSGFEPAPMSPLSESASYNIDMSESQELSHSTSDNETENDDWSFNERLSTSFQTPMGVPTSSFQDFCDVQIVQPRTTIMPFTSCPAAAVLAQ
mmetsp:Transcript_6883/g.7542  ORF Transcript_6883/g.7542 Transcript_6883/m.7542 type:complete len:134 (+) Transcript_6883:183-584(+)